MLRAKGGRLLSIFFLMPVFHVTPETKYDSSALCHFQSICDLARLHFGFDELGFTTSTYVSQDGKTCMEVLKDYASVSLCHDSD